MSETTVPTIKERLAELTASIEKGIQELFQSDRYAKYLRTMAQFHRYSLGNTMLIYLQKPEATLVAGFDKWKNRFSRNVKKGEKGIRIIAPVPYKKTVEQEKLDPVTGAPLLDADGMAITEEKVIQVPRFKPVAVFDVSQTYGKPLPQLVSDLTGSVQGYEVLMEALRRSSPVPITLQAMASSMDGSYNDKEKSIAIREGMSETQTISAAIHEIAHAKLHRRTPAENDTPAKDRRTAEVEAESVSYAVCGYYGIATGENSFGYIASWSKGKELSELKNSLETINRTASSLITDIDRHVADIRRERGLDVAQQDANTRQADGTQPEHALSAPDPAMTPEVLASFGYTDQDMHPLSRERAMELFERGLPVHLLSEGNSQALATRIEDITNHTGICGITKADWQAAALPEQRSAQTKDAEQSFRESQDNTYLVYQMRTGDELRDMRFQPYSQMQGRLSPQQYEAVLTGAFQPAQDTQAALNSLYATLNEPLPWDTQARSLSMGDVIALKRDGQVTCHYVDRTGFVELPGFFSGRNPLRSLEDAVEQNDNQLDGIINNMPPQLKEERRIVKEPAQERPPARKSVLAQIRQPNAADTRQKPVHPERQI